MILQGALYLHSMPKGETKDLLLFVVPKAHCVAALNGCTLLLEDQSFCAHRDAGHQGHDHTLSLLWECFWWPGMINQIQQSIKNCIHCLQHDGDLPKVSLHLIMATAPLDLLHIDFISTEMTMELNRPSCQCPGVPGPFHEACYSICDPQSDS